MNKWGVGLTLLLASASVLAKDIQLLNVSYDPTRELYEQYNKAFSAHWKQETGDNVVIRQSHGGSGKQATSVINGIEADVVTLALAYDVDAIAERGRIDKNWLKRLPDNSAPYTSTIVFLVRKGNPETDPRTGTIRSNRVFVITRTRKARRRPLKSTAAWAPCIRITATRRKAQEFVKALYKNVEVLDSGARGSTNTFVERGIGDIAVAWENEALLATNGLGKDKFEIVTKLSRFWLSRPSRWSTKWWIRKARVRWRKRTLKYLYSPEGQEIAAKNFYRPRDRMWRRNMLTNSRN
ncbi:sulfate ABC transporter substrate-binding protein [Klebsiella pneumoniae]|nr:sulfate ABC transporter substrate-binding protein [Klebsiella pneumoniae]